MLSEKNNPLNYLFYLLGEGNSFLLKWLVICIFRGLEKISLSEISIFLALHRRNYFVAPEQAAVYESREIWRWVGLGR